MFETLECPNSFEVASNDSLQQCLTCSGGKIHEKVGFFYWGGWGERGGGVSNLVLKGSKSVPKLGFFLFSQVCFISLP